MLRQKLIEAAARVYGEYGFRGATTRRIAEAAGVNEVTIFRHFGSKNALIEEVIRCCAAERAGPRLPDVPVEPVRELTEYAAAHLDMLRDRRAVIRKTMGELEERPDVACMVGEGTKAGAMILKRYMQRLAEHGLVTFPGSTRDGRNEEAHAAGAMLMGALFADAMGRDMMPEMYPQPVERAAELYVRAFLRAIAYEPATPGGRNGRKAAGSRGKNGGTRSTGSTRSTSGTGRASRAAAAKQDTEPRAAALRSRSSTTTRSRT